MTNSLPWNRWPIDAIEIDGLPFLQMVDLSMAMLVITRWYMERIGNKNIEKLLPYVITLVYSSKN